MFKHPIVKALVVAILTMWVSGVVMANFAPASMTDNEAKFYTYGGGALGAWLAMTYVLKSSAA